MTKRLIDEIHSNFHRILDRNHGPSPLFTPSSLLIPLSSQWTPLPSSPWLPPLQIQSPLRRSVSTSPSSWMPSPSAPPVSLLRERMLWLLNLVFLLLFLLCLHSPCALLASLAVMTHMNTMSTESTSVSSLSLSSSSSSSSSPPLSHCCLRKISDWWRLSSSR
jgi:hypothetical protein